MGKLGVYLMQDMVTEYLTHCNKSTAGFGKELQSLSNFIHFLEEANKHGARMRTDLDIPKTLGS